MPWLPGRANGRGLATRLVSSGATAVAMVAVLLVVGLGVTRAWGRISHPGGTASPLVSTYATGNGQRADITLPDGSVVSLNVASRLEVPADFAAGNRTVRLVGSALFTVSRHDGRPFTVTAGSGVVRVLGTSFLVRHYETDSTVLVAVRDGKVSVRSLVLMATQQVELGPGTVSPVRPVNPGAFTFATGVLTLDGPPLSGAVEDLDRWYDADIRLGSPALAAQRITGKFAAGSLSDLAAILELTFDVRVVRDGRRLTLYSR